MALSEKQERILEFIGAFLTEHGFPPTVRDIQKGCGMSSTSVVDYNLRILERLSYLRRSREVSRGIELARRGRGGMVRIPLVGVIAAGAPLPVPSVDPRTLDEGDFLEVGEEMVQGQGEVFAVRVQGTSMIDALIDDGDVVLLQRTDRVENGGMVAAWLVREGETTLKRFYREGSRVRLQPENRSMAPLIMDAREVQVQGKVIGIIRKYR